VKSIPVTLLAHKRLPATTLCMLLRVRCKDGTNYGFSNLDHDVTYDDGDGPLIYSARQGFLPTAIQNTDEIAVGNADLFGLFGDLVADVTPEQIRAGKLDYAQIYIYQVNYEDLSMGHEWMGRGSVGEGTVNNGQFTFEYRSLAQPTKQSVCEVYSLTCRAQYGDARCGKDLVWIDAAITAVGADPTSQFTASGLGQEDGYFDPGVIQFTSGQNDQKYIEVDSFTTGGVIQLLFPVYYPLQVGDTFRIRIDCNKRSDVTGCKDPRRWGSPEWRYHFRGEPNIPVADGDSIQTPGANL
jgi:uncharacterized phage protein (TIGR02218 family)